MKDIDQVELKALYLDQRETVTDIAKHFDCAVATVHRYLRKLG